VSGIFKVYFYHFFVDQCAFSRFGYVPDLFACQGTIAPFIIESAFVVSTFLGGV
jgi:hypothetical protein